MEIIKPAYYNEFNCIGGKCKNNCCNEDWKIMITKKEYDQICTLTNNTDWANIEPPSIGYASIKNNGKCAFFDSDGLCRFHKEYGHAALNKTCKIFPRHSLFINDVGMVVCSTACEEVVKLLMNVPYVELVSEQGEITDPVVIVNKNINKVRPFSKYIFDLQTAGIAILQDRFYTLDQRMIILSSFLLKVDKFEKANDYVALSALIDETLNAKDDVTLVESFNCLTPNIIAKMENASSIFIKTGLCDYVNTIDFKVIKNDNSVGMNYNFDKVVGQIAMLDEYLKDKVYLENIMVNIFFQMLVPFKLQDRSIDINAMYFVTVYNTLKLFLATYTAELDDNSFVDATVIASRRMLHNSKVAQFTIDIQDSINLSFDYLVSLIV